MVKTPAKKTKAKATPAKKKAARKKTPPSRAELLKQALSGDKAASLVGDMGDTLWSTPKYWISTRNMALDKALGGRGLPGGKIIEVFGRPQSGKSTTLDQIIAEVQSMGGLAILIDTEQARDLTYMAALGVNLNELIVCQVTTIEDVFKRLLYWCEHARQVVEDLTIPIVVVWDSLAGTPTKAEWEADLEEEPRVGGAAKVLRRAMRRVSSVVAKTGVTVIIANQVYTTIGRRGGTDKASGGDGVAFHASTRIHLWSGDNQVVPLSPRGSTKTDKVSPVGQVVWATVVKNKTSAPLAKAEFSIMFGHGVDNGYAIWNDNCGPKTSPPKEAFIVQSGSWYRLADELGDFPAWQGAHWGLNDLAIEHPEVWAEIVERYKAL